MHVIPAFIGVPGGPELLIILALAVLLFGANKLPQLARSSGQAMGEFRKGREEIETEIREAASDATAESEDAASESA
jgi:sec-independent protein translocase protein TatA